MRRPVAATLAVAGIVAWLVGLLTLAVGPAGADEAVPAPGETSASATVSVEPSEEPSAPTTDPTTDPTPDPTPDPSEPTSEPTDSTQELSDAVLRWGLNVESNTAAYNPGTYNFLVAGKIPNPGAGGHTVQQSEWRQRAGDVAVEKWNAAAGAWRPATWAGLRTDSRGGALTIGTSSNHELVFSGGTGTVDRTARTAEVRWTGSATVVYYSGASFFYLSDPVLSIADGAGRITATLGGFGSSQADLTAWVPLPDTEVTIASLPSVSFDDEDGFSVDPAYRGVGIDLTAGTQVRTGADWGAFPQSWVSFMERVGTAAFWYSSGGAADPNKVAAPLTVAWDAGRAVDTPTPVVPTTSAPEVENDAPDPPTTTPATSGSGSGGAPAPAAVAPAAPAAAGQPAVATDELVLQSGTTTSTVAAPPTASADQPVAWPWWGGGALLLLAAALLLAPAPRRS